MDPNNSVVRLFLGGKKTSFPRFRSLSVSLAGDGRCGVFGSMVCENQVAGRKADDIRRKVLERG